MVIDNHTSAFKQLNSFRSEQ